jgi:ribosomal protein S18 acetylase RimI-like enzyme
MTNRQDDGVPEPVRIDALRADLASEAGVLLAASHANYPSFRHLFPDPPRRCRVLRPFMSAAARDAALHARAKAAYDSSGIIGVALWMPPGTFPLSLGRKARMAPALLQAALSARGAFPAFARVGATLEKVHPHDSSWYLQAMGVHPRAQRRGVGKQLLSPTLALADESGLPCHLHTSDPANIEYYERFGFEVSQPAIEVFAHGPHYIGMTRPSHGHSAHSGLR